MKIGEEGIFKDYDLEKDLFVSKQGDLRCKYKFDQEALPSSTDDINLIQN